MTAQDTDLIEFTDTDYNSLRTSIYSPNVGPAAEVNIFVTKIILLKIFLIQIG